MRVLANQLGKKIGKQVELRGWVHRLRELGGKQFIVLRDMSGLVQIVAEPDKVDGKLDVETVISVKGIVKKDERAPGGFEVHGAIEVQGESAPDWPFHRYMSTELQLDKRHLWLRSTKMQAAFKIRQTILSASRDFLAKQGFWEVAPPILVSSACESGSTLFELEYFGSKAYLSQSSQLYLEAFLPSLERVWALTPSFRAEKSRTRRHVTEYWHLEPEAAWVDYEQNMTLQEDMLKHIIKQLLDKSSDALAEFGDRAAELEKWRKEKWARMRYGDVIDKLKPKFPKLKWGDDLGTKEERYLVDHLDSFVFVTHYPREMKAFYMKVDEEDTKLVLNNDLMAPHVGEAIGGSEREWKLDLLKENMKIHKLKSADYEWYLELRKYGSVPHSGFGLGIERLMMSLLKLEHIRETLPFPRFMNRVYP
ncbi:MAG: asparagine--tRNA ligase [Candidatus Altiarchaeota archaeon]|nr:asparagine--tRNA ligase [Candidatus Altiarchaeota archaeon]